MTSEGRLNGLVRVSALVVLLVGTLVVTAAAGGACAATGPVSTAGVTSPTAVVPPTQTTAILPQGTDGSPDSGDPYFPAQGNGGYDVRSYDITLDIDPVSGRITGRTAVGLVATQDLSAFYLDLDGLEVSAVQVGGSPVEFRRQGQDLKVVLPNDIAAGSGITTVVSYSGVPTAMPTKLYTMGWHEEGDTIFTLDEPQGAATWFPVNDTPADKASYTFHLTVPAEYTATANGLLTNTETSGTRRTFTWQMDAPMASYLAQVDVGRFAMETSDSAAGVPIRNYFAADLAAAAHTAFARIGEVLDYYAGLFGPYPFPVYGVVVPDADTGAAMENQTLSLYGRDVVQKRMGDPTTGAVYLSHELAHQWFGDSVSFEHWDDVWLAEGFATYASWLWLEHDLGRQALEDQVAQSKDMLDRSVEPPPGTPGPDHLFGVSVYRRGALTLHALRLTVGDDDFFRTLRTWAERYRYGSATTADLVAVVKESAPRVAPADIDAFFRSWLYDEKMPALPGAPGV